MAPDQVSVQLSLNRPQSCDDDLKRVCGEIAFQNTQGNHLVGCEIKENQIKLKLEGYSCQKQ